MDKNRAIAVAVQSGATIVWGNETLEEIINDIESASDGVKEQLVEAAQKFEETLNKLGYKIVEN